METQYQTSFNAKPVKQANNRLDKIKSLFMRLKNAHQYYKLYGSDPVKHEEILAKSEPLISELESLGVHKSFSEALLFFGKEFLDFEYGKEDVVSRAEKVFGVKATKTTDEEIKIHGQVADRALVYTVKSGKPKILVYKKGQEAKGGIPPSVT